MNENEILHSLLRADEEIYPSFTSEEKEQELEYIRSHQDELKQKVLDAVADPTRVDEAQRYFDQLEFWDNKLEEFYQKYPDFKE